MGGERAANDTEVYLVKEIGRPRVGDPLTVSGQVLGPCYPCWPRRHSRAQRVHGCLPQQVGTPKEKTR